jgi:hypothetical protein
MVSLNLVKNRKKLTKKERPCGDSSKLPLRNFSETSVATADIVLIVLENAGEGKWTFIFS